MRKTLRSGATEPCGTVFRRRARGPSAPEYSDRHRFQAEFAELERLSRRPASSLAEQLGSGRAGPSVSRPSFRVMASRLQAEAFGDIEESRWTAGANDKWRGGKIDCQRVRDARLRCGIEDLVGSSGLRALILKPGALLIREWQGRLERVTVVDDGLAWNGTTYAACRAPSPSLARSGTAIGFSACDVEITSPWASVRMMRKGLMDAKGQHFAARQADQPTSRGVR